MRGDVIAAAACAFVFGGGIAVSIEKHIKGTPEQEAKRDVERCTEIARLMLSYSPAYFNPPLSSNSERGKPWDLGTPVAPDPSAVYGVTLSCLLGRR